MFLNIWLANFRLFQYFFLILWQNLGDDPFSSSFTFGPKKRRDHVPTFSKYDIEVYVSMSPKATLQRSWGYATLLLYFDMREFLETELASATSGFY